MYIFYLYSRLAVFSFSRPARSFVSGAFGLCYARINVRAPDDGDWDEKGCEKRGGEKRDPFSLSQCGESICMIHENTETHNEAWRNDATFLSTFEFADTPIGLQSAGFRRMRFCERGCNYLTRYPNFFSRLCALVIPYRILFRIPSSFFVRVGRPYRVSPSLRYRIFIGTSLTLNFNIPRHIMESRTRQIESENPYPSRI